jgi:hypothetical protein
MVAVGLTVLLGNSLGTTISVAAFRQMDLVRPLHHALVGQCVLFVFVLVS